MWLKKEKILCCFQYIIMFLMFTYWPNALLDDILCRSIILFLLIACTIIKGKLQFSRHTTVILTLLLSLHGLTMLLGSRSFALDLGNISALLMCFVFVSIIKYEEFRIRYVKLIYFISVYSLIMFLINVVNPAFFSVFPVVKATTKVANMFFSLIPVGHYNYPRNYGCSGEPGMYAVYLSMALLFEFFAATNINIKHVIIFTLSMVTTFSTAGYISFFLIWFAFLHRIRKKKDLVINRREKYFLLSMVSFVFILFFYLYFSGKLGLADYVLKKLTEFGKDSGTSFERLRALYLALKTAVQYFPFGAGWGIYESIYLQGIILVTTPLNWFAIYGILYGTIMNTGIILLSISMAKQKMDAIFIWLSIMAILVAQEMSSTYLFILLIFYMFANGIKVNLKGGISVAR